MAEGASKGQETLGKAKGGLGFSPGLLILGVAALLVASMGSAFLAVTFLGKTAGAAKPAATAEGEAPKKAEVGPTQEVGNFTVNLADAGERVYIKAGVAFELSNAEAQAELTSREAQVKDIIISVLGAHTQADVAALAGKEKIKGEIRDRVNKLLSKGRVANVFFTEFVFQ
ncbi:MAG: flagellar basal body-associated protein FliL [Chitinophagales bacterium]